ncbi:MAG: hypothetical protein QXV30_07040 [Desulfurococcaceae archaeon]
MRLMQAEYSKMKSISTVIGTAIALAILIAFTTFFMSTVSRTIEYISELTYISLSKADVVNVVKSIDGSWIEDNDSLVINLRSNYHEAILLTGLVIVYSNGTYVTISRNNVMYGEVRFVNANRGIDELSKLQLPKALGPGYSITITVPKAPNSVSIVTIVISIPQAVVTIPLHKC